MNPLYRLSSLSLGMCETTICTQNKANVIRGRLRDLLGFDPDSRVALEAVLFLLHILKLHFSILHFAILLSAFDANICNLVKMAANMSLYSWRRVGWENPGLWSWKLCLIKPSFSACVVYETWNSIKMRLQKLSLRISYPAICQSRILEICLSLSAIHILLRLLLAIGFASIRLKSFARTWFFPPLVGHFFGCNAVNALMEWNSFCTFANTWEVLVFPVVLVILLIQSLFNPLLETFIDSLFLYDLMIFLK